MSTYLRRGFFKVLYENPKIVLPALILKEKGSPRAGGGWPGETALNKMGCRGDLSYVNLIPNLDLTKYNTEFRHSSYPTRFSPTSLGSH